jgi:hypothetical protein
VARAQLAPEFVEFRRAVEETAAALGRALAPVFAELALAFQAFGEAARDAILALGAIELRFDDELAACGTLHYVEHPEALEPVGERLRRKLGR